MSVNTVSTEAGKAIFPFIRNLSFISQPCDWVAAMVVSEIKERLSPNIAPPKSEPAISSTFTLGKLTKPAAIGAKLTTAPTEVPEAKERKEAMTKTPAYRYCNER